MVKTISHIATFHLHT